MREKKIICNTDIINLTKGKKYNVTKESEGLYYIVNDNKEQEGYSKSYFKEKTNNDRR